MLIKLLDLGSNSFQVQRLKVEQGRITKLEKAKNFYRLGARLTQGGSFSAETIADCVTAVERLLQAVAGEARECVGIATQAIRQASNGRELLERLTERVGLAVFLLAPEEEAELAYRGALTELEGQIRDTLVVDLGGGSTELACGDEQGSSVRASLPLGTLQLQSEPHDPLALERRIRAEFQRLQPLAPRSVVFASGAPRAAVDVARGLGILSASGRSFSKEQLTEMREVSERASDPELCAAGCPSERLDTLRPALRLMSALVEVCRAETWCVVRSGVREGTAQVIEELWGPRGEIARDARGVSNSLLARVNGRLQPNTQLVTSDAIPLRKLWQPYSSSKTIPISKPCSSTT